ILSAGVRSLPVELCWVMRHREQNLQQFTVGYFFRVEKDLYRLRMACLTAADNFILSRRFLTTRISGQNFLYATHMLKNPLDAPKAACGHHSSLGWALRFRIVDQRCWKRDVHFSGKGRWNTDAQRR